MTAGESGDGVLVGTDVGGTFTDTVAIRDGQITVTKTPSTPADPTEGVLDGVERSGEAAGYDPTAVSAFDHGTTVATNALLEGTLADTALVTTEGFRDALAIGRQDRPDIYDFDVERPAPVVPRDRRFTIAERMNEQGEPLVAPDESALADLVDRLAAVDPDAVAVCLLFAFENDAHERRVGERLREAFPAASVSLSSEVRPEIREYERTVTTCLNAALQPTMSSYIERLADRVRRRGIDATLRIMGSHGGLMTANAAGERPVETLLSGPAAGVRAATTVAGRRGAADVLTMDMGGTSCDVSLVEDGTPVVSTDVTVGDFDVGVPMVDVHTVGAGGSVAWVDSGGALRVGPQSVGADPGPVCYGWGGQRPTVTDAHLLLGRLDPELFLDDSTDATVADVREAVERDIADPLSRSVEAAAQAMLDVTNADMRRALRVVSVERGYDPRSFSLVAYGGAGPLHAAALAADLGVPEVVIPRNAGVLSALGLCLSDVAYEFSVSRVRALTDLDPGSLQSMFATLRERGESRLDDDGVPPADRRFERAVDLRYAGQSSSLTVSGPTEFTRGALDALAERFHDRHEYRYGHANRSAPVELETARLDAVGRVETPSLNVEETEAASLRDARRETRSVVFDGETRETPVYCRPSLPVSCSFDGPAVVEGEGSTAVVYPGQRATVDEDGNLVVRTGGA